MSASLAVRYDSVEDRLLLTHTRLSAENVPIRSVLHVTRRVCADWRRDMQLMATMSAQAPATLSIAARAALSAAHHQAMVRQSSLRAAPAVDSAPIPTSSVLVLQVCCGRRRGDGRWVMRFDLSEGSKLHLTLSTEALHGVIEAVARQIARTSWHLAPLPLEAEPPDSTTAEMRWH